MKSTFDTDNSISCTHKALNNVFTKHPISPFYTDQLGMSEIISVDAENCTITPRRGTIQPFRSILLALFVETLCGCDYVINKHVVY